MEEQKKQETGGRPTERGPVHRTNIDLPQELWDYITRVSPANRTTWIVQALEEKREREEQGSVAASSRDDI